MQTERKIQNHIFVCFPGMGKTTYALHNPGVVDLDFGYLRQALKVPKDEQHTIYAAFQRLAGYYYREGFNVLTNDQGLIPFLKQFAGDNIVMVLPKDTKELVDRVAIREHQKGAKGNNSFVHALRQNAEQWVDDWYQVALRYHVPVYYERYFDEAVVGKLKFQKLKGGKVTWQ